MMYITPIRIDLTQKLRRRLIQTKMLMIVNVMQYRLSRKTRIAAYNEHNKRRSNNNNNNNSKSR